MFAFAALISFIISVIFYAFSVGHHPWTYIMFALIGFACAMASKIREG